MSEIYTTQGFDEDWIPTRSEHVQALMLRPGDILFVTVGTDEWIPDSETLHNVKCQWERVLPDGVALLVQPFGHSALDIGQFDLEAVNNVERFFEEIYWPEYPREAFK